MRFDIEKSHITNPDRFSKLVVVCAVASAIIIKNGLIQNQLNPIKVRTRARLSQTISFVLYLWLRSYQKLLKTSEE